MKKIGSLILVLVILSGVVLALTGCGNDNDKAGKSDNNKLIDDLNEIISDEISSWEEQGFSRTLTVTYIQSCIDYDDLQYEIVASGDEEFTEAPDFTEYEEDVPDYSGNSYSQLRMIEKSSNINYFVVYDKNKEKYYNVKVSIEETEFHSVKKAYPVFSEAKELK